MVERHHKRDGSSLFKERSLMGIHRRKLMEKALKATLVAIAILMALAVLFAYTIG